MARYRKNAKRTTTRRAPVARVAAGAAAPAPPASSAAERVVRGTRVKNPDTVLRVVGQSLAARDLALELAGYSVFPDHEVRMLALANARELLAGIENRYGDLDTGRYTGSGTPYMPNAALRVPLDE